MTTFRCRVLTPDGRDDWRTLDAVSQEAAVARLLAEGTTPLDVRSGVSDWQERLNQPIKFGGNLRVGEQALVLKQLATLVSAGLPVDRSLDLVMEQTTRRGARQILAQAVRDLRGGASLATALERLQSFPGFVIGVLRAAERGGDLDLALQSVSDRISSSASARRQMVTALSYPLAVLVAAIGALSLILTQVVPQFAPIFAGEEARLPALTQTVLAMSQMLTDHSRSLLVATALAVAGIITLWRSPPPSLRRPAVRRHLPGLSLRDQYLAGQVVGILGTLVRNGVAIAQALPLARGAISSATWRAALDRAERQVREGGKLSRALDTMDLIPATAIRLIEVGERSGGLAEACGHASAVIADAAKAKLDRTIALANPIAILLLGGLVGALVAGVMLGIFALGDFAG